MAPQSPRPLQDFQGPHVRACKSHHSAQEPAWRSQLQAGRSVGASALKLRQDPQGPHSYVVSPNTHPRSPHGDPIQLQAGRSVGASVSQSPPGPPEAALLCCTYIRVCKSQHSPQEPARRSQLQSGRSVGASVSQTPPGPRGRGRTFTFVSPHTIHTFHELRRSQLAGRALNSRLSLPNPAKPPGAARTAL